MPAVARGDPPAARVDVLGDTQRQGAVVVVQGSGESGWAGAEALVWGGATTAGLSANALTAAVTIRDPRGACELRIGRFVFATGAIRPVQIDGASALARAPWGTKFETFAGMPVSLDSPRDFSWIAGGRVSQTVGTRMVLGASYVQRREGTDVADEEVGLDFAAAPVRFLDVAARAAYDLVSPGVTEAIASAAARVGDFRFEVFASDRSPSRLLPDTSLFTVFGDFASQNVGATIHWKAAPRLDLWLVGEGQYVGSTYGANAIARARLSLDDRGEGSLFVEARREDVSTAQWTGLRFTATRPITRALRWSTELELVIPDQPQGKGVAWPWGLASLGWRASKRVELAAAIQAASTPEHLYEVNALGRLSLLLGGTK